MHALILGIDLDVPVRAWHSYALLHLGAHDNDHTGLLMLLQKTQVSSAEQPEISQASAQIPITSHSNIHK
jgi:hypothetical protein